MRSIEVDISDAEICAAVGADAAKLAADQPGITLRVRVAAIAELAAGSGAGAHRRGAAWAYWILLYVVRIFRELARGAVEALSPTGVC